MTLQVRRSRTDGDDGELIERVRHGDDDAFAELYRRHLRAATNVARALLRSGVDADDAVSESFTGVLHALRNGHGPHDSFRAYLLACVRNACSVRRSPPIPRRSDELEADLPAFEDPERYVEADTVARAFASLSPRWQQALWMTEVEQRSASEVGARLGVAPNSIAALTYRAREGFASAYLTEHVARAATPACAAIARRLGAYVRHTSSARDTAAVERHLVVCAPCRRAVDELRDVNGSLRSLEGPAAAAGAAAAVASTVVVGSATVGGGVAAATTGGVLLKVAALVLLAVPVATLGGQRFSHHDPVVHETTFVAPVAEAAQTGVVPAVIDAPQADASVGSVDRGSAASTVMTDSTTFPPLDQTAPAPAAVPPTVLPPDVASGSTVPRGTAVVIASAPVTSAPAITVPAISLPPISVPPLTTPPISTPPISTPPATTPVISIGPFVVPAVTVPSVTVPSVTVPPITVAPLGLPSVTIPPIGIPGIG